MPFAVAVIRLHRNQPAHRLLLDELHRLAMAPQRERVVAIAPCDGAKVIQRVGHALRLVQRTRRSERALQRVGRARVVVGAAVRHAELDQDVARPRRFAELRAPASAASNDVTAAPLRPSCAWISPASSCSRTPLFGIDRTAMLRCERQRTLDRVRRRAQRRQLERTLRGQLVAA